MEKGSCSSPKKKTGGKRKISIELIHNNDARQVCFSKRRKGLFKKATELSVLCGAQVRVVAFSPAGNPYYHFSPSTQPTDNNEALPDLMSTDLGRQVSDLHAKLEATKRRNEDLKARREEIMKESVWNFDITNANLGQLVAAKMALEQVRILTKSAADVSLNSLVAQPSSSSDVPDMGASTSTVPDKGLGTSAVQDMGVGANAVVPYQTWEMIPDMGAGTSTVPEMGYCTSTVEDMGVDPSAVVPYQYQAPYGYNFN